MMKRKTFTFRDSWFEAMRNLPDNTRLALMDAICSYAIEGKIPENLEMTAQTAFILIRAEIDNTPAPRKKTKPEEDKPSESTETIFQRRQTPYPTVSTKPTTPWPTRSATAGSGGTGYMSMPEYAISWRLCRHSKTLSENRTRPADSPIRSCRNRNSAD